MPENVAFRIESFSYHKLTIFALNFKMTLMLWLHGNDPILRAAIFWHLQAYLTNITNAIQFGRVE